MPPPTGNTRKPREDRDGWAWTPGEAQYEWLQRSLQGSKAPYKFVFIHHLVGGSGRDARGGTEAAKYFEWGGRSPGSGADFKTMRPGWPKPIHDLLRECMVRAINRTTISLTTCVQPGSEASFVYAASSCGWTGKSQQFPLAFLSWTWLERRPRIT